MTSPYGNTGNGFDFQIRPFGGQPAAVTSVPYPVVAEEGFDARVEHAFDITLIQNLEEFESSSVALEGEMRDILKRYSEGPEEIDSIIATALSGSMAAILHVTYADDAYDAVMARALNGSMRRILIEIDMETDSFDGVTAVATGGTMQ